MAGLDRDELIELLDRLGRESDEEVLESAREVNRVIRQADVDWDDVIRSQADLGGEAEAGSDADTGDDEASDKQPATGKSGANLGDDGRLIDKIAARSDLSAEMRGELDMLRRDLAEGDFSSDDRAYLRALAKRIGVK